LGAVDDTKAVEGIAARERPIIRESFVHIERIFGLLLDGRIVMTWEEVGLLLHNVNYLQVTRQASKGAFRQYPALITYQYTPCRSSYSFIQPQKLGKEAQY
jgi:hypothetical protein